ncbi:hypothetical protein [Sphaerochaeta sp. PS]|uniref:hypothetical protein n=1 Tax=Sphaerochaeta sp. PS TaxID=3076336 RepID=UPI0028A48E14|nr:hypothetical protein [Sphaerochaeta sp. PS]MDT4761384.1 hypothetical protein [Sphaerochaeta sp. PS]
MKRIVLMVVAFSLLASPLVGRSLGYGVGFYGQSIIEEEAASSSGVELSFVYQPWLLPVGNPSLIAKAVMGTDMTGKLVFPYVEFGLSVDLFRTIHHPFNLFANNVVAYDPAVSVSYHRDAEAPSQLLSISVSPFKLSQKDFWYEFFVPSVSIDIQTGKVASWGIALIRYTYIFK